MRQPNLYIAIFFIGEESNVQFVFLHSTSEEPESTQAHTDKSVRICAVPHEAATTDAYVLDAQADADATLPVARLHKTWSMYEHYTVCLQREF